MTDLDTLRADNPDLGFAVYAYEPGKPVTLEIHAVDGIYPFTGATLAEAIGKAFPPQINFTADEKFVAVDPVHQTKVTLDEAVEMGLFGELRQHKAPGLFD